MTSFSRFTLLSLLLCSGCAGVYLPPVTNVPALRAAGQASFGVSTRLLSPQTATHAVGAVAITDQLRLAGTLSGGFVRSQRRGLYGEALLGAEPMLSRLLQLGVLGGVGYGDVRTKHDACHDTHTDGVCLKPRDIVDQAQATYVRYSVQAYLAVHAPKIAHGGGGLRLALIDMHVHELDGHAVNVRARPIAIEPFFFGRVGLPFFQAEVQLRYSDLVNAPHDAGRRVIWADRLTLLVGARFVFGPGITRRWP
ncbi:MAG TPA: hypothetical protein VFX59_05370 [Polyangiales bacterium]|nr:hypothetical protein [Polyangiales bacterium]